MPSKPHFSPAEFHHRSWRLGHTMILPATGEVMVPTRSVAHLHPRAMEVLRLLAAAYPNPASRKDVIDQVWQGNFLVGDPALTKEICLLRNALGDNPQSPILIKTIPRTGYALLKPLEPEVSRGRRRRRVTAAGLLAGLFVAALVAIWPPDPGTGADPQTAIVLKKARHLVGHREPEGLQQALDMLRDELGRRPGDPELLAELADVLLRQPAADREWDEARKLAQRALRIDQDQAVAIRVLGQITLFRDWNWPQAESFISRAMELTPAEPDLLMLHASYLVSLGNFEAGLAVGRKALSLDPISALLRNDAAWLAYLASEFDEAEQRARELKQLEPNDVQVNYLLAKMLAADGDYERACVVLKEQVEELATEFQDGIGEDRGRSCYARYLELSREWWEASQASSARSLVLATIEAKLGRPRKALPHITDLVNGRSSYLPFLAVDPAFEPLHDWPEWQTLMREAGHPLAYGKSSET